MSNRRNIRYPAETLSRFCRQTTATNSGNPTRAEDVLLVQTSLLDRLFAQLTGTAHAQNRPKRTLAELKAPRQVAFVQQANIGNQVQVDNGTTRQPARTEIPKDTKRTIRGGT